MKKKTRIILDTNIFVSALIINSTNLKDLVEFVFREFEVCFSLDLINEVLSKFNSPKFKPNPDGLLVFNELIDGGRMFYPKLKINFQADPKDAFLLALAEESEADYLITGDKKYLLPLGKWKNTKILSVNDFLSIWS